MKLIGYCRVSTDKQGQEGHSLEEQHVRLKAYVAAHPGWELISVESEVGSAKNMNRPKLQKCLHLISKGEVDGLIVTALDRMTRSLSDLLHIVNTYFPHDQPSNKKTNLLSISETLDLSTPNGRMIVYLFSVFGQWQREITSENSRRVSAHLKAAGKRYNAQPLFGMKVDPDDPSRLTACPQEQAVLDRIRELRCTEGLSLTETVLVLRDEDLRNRAGTYWSKPSISRLCRRHDFYPPSQDGELTVESSAHS